MTKESTISVSIRPIVWGATIFTVSCLLAIARFKHEGWTLIESVYMVVITVFGIGYEEVHDIDTPGLRMFMVVFIIAGYSSAIFTLGAIARFVAEGEIMRLIGVRRMGMEIDRLRDHVVICGFGRVGHILADELNEAGQKFVIVDSGSDRCEQARAAGFLAVQGDATDEGALIEAGVTRARTIASCLSDDALSVFITLTTRDLNPRAEIIARAEAMSTKSKLERSGTTQVVLPAEIGAAKMAKLIINPSAEVLLSDHDETDLFNEELGEFGLSMREMTLPASSQLQGEPLSAVDLSGSRGMLVVAIRSDSGDVHACPNGATILSAGDTLVLLGHRDDLDGLGERLALREQQLI